MQLWSQVDLPMVTVLQHGISGSGHGQMSVRVPLTQNCLNNVFLHIKSMVTVVVGLVTTLTGSKGRIDPAAARNAVHSWRMSTVSPRTTFRVTSDPRHNKVYLPVLCALHEWPLTQMSSIAGVIRPLSAVPCCKWRVTLDTDVMSSHCRCYATTCSWNVKVSYRGDAVDIPLIWKLCSREWHKHQYWVSLSCRAAPVGLKLSQQLLMKVTSCSFCKIQIAQTLVGTAFYTTASSWSCSGCSHFELQMMQTGYLRWSPFVLVILLLPFVGGVAQSNLRPFVAYLVWITFDSHT